MYLYSIYINIYSFIFLFIKVVCGRCNKSMLYMEYEKKHKLTHYNLCWINDEEKLVSYNLLQ